MGSAAVALDGAGDGYGAGYGDGYGSGYGAGYGYGAGDGYGDVVAAAMFPVIITDTMLALRKACSDQLCEFRRLFPDGATWPDDIEKAEKAGLDISWAQRQFGLLRPK